MASVSSLDQKSFDRRCKTQGHCHLATRREMTVNICMPVVCVATCVHRELDARERYAFSPYVVVS